MQEEVEGRNALKVKICFSGETPIYTYCPLDWDTRGDFGSHNEEVVVYAGMDASHRRLVAGTAFTATHVSSILTVNREVVVHAGMNDFHRRLVAGVAFTATHESAILTENRDKKREILLAVSSKDRKREILLAVSSKDRKYRVDRILARIVVDTISKEKTTQQVSFSDKQVDTMKDVSIPRTFLSKNVHSSTTEEDLSEMWELSISQAALTLKETTKKLTISAIMPLTRRYRADRIFIVRRIYGTMSTNTMDARFQSIHDKKYCQVFGNKKLFVEANPIKKKYDCNLGLYKFVKEY